MKFLVKSTVLTFFVALTLFSCTKDFEDINTDPNDFTTASSGSLFNGIIESLILTGNEQFYINNEILYKQTQLAANTRDAWGNFTIGTESMWSNYYLSLPNFRELEKRFSELDTVGGANNMKAMLKILLAYKTFRVTDIFGDIPFSNAGYGFQYLEYIKPKYDSQEEIYKFLLEELKWCDENIDEAAVNEEPFLTFKTFDVIFNGDMLKWQKLANSLRLRYALRMSEKEPELAGEIIKEIVENERPVLVGYGFTAYVGESAYLMPGEVGYKNTSLSWSFREHKNLRMGTNIWHQFSANDSTDGSGIFDPRAYIFFEPNNAGKWAPYPQVPEPNTPPSAGIPYDEHRDNAAAYQIKGESCIYSPFNYFVIADEYYMPIIMMTGAEVHFILSEAYYRGIGLPADPDMADIEYMNGINSSVEWWKNIADNSKLPLSGLRFPDVINLPENKVLNYFGSWMAESEEQRMEFLYTQRWIDLFRQPWEAYALTRRTQKTPREGDALNYFRLPYPPSEVEYNSENWANAVSNQGGDTPEFKIWWMP